MSTFILIWISKIVMLLTKKPGFVVASYIQGIVICTISLWTQNRDAYVSDVYLVFRSLTKAIPHGGICIIHTTIKL
jgi:hypothetical protein